MNLRDAWHKFGHNFKFNPNQEKTKTKQKQKQKQTNKQTKHLVRTNLYATGKFSGLTVNM